MPFVRARIAVFVLAASVLAGDDERIEALEGSGFVRAANLLAQRDEAVRKRAVPVIVGLADRDGGPSPDKICWALTRMGAPGLPGLVELFGHRRQEVRDAAVAATRRYEPEVVLPALLAAFARGSTRAKRSAALAAGLLEGQAAVEAVPLVVDALQDRELAGAGLAAGTSLFAQPGTARPGVEPSGARSLRGLNQSGLDERPL